MPKKQPVKKSPRTPIGKGERRTAPERERSAASVDREVCDKCGVVHPGCRAHTKHGPNTGRPCGMKPRIGSLVCAKHGGNHPAHKKAAKERLLELVDPALAALHKVLTDPNTDDHNKVRAAQLVLDRTGFRPGVEVTLQPSKWDVFLDGVMLEVDRDHLPDALASGGDRDPMPLGYEDVEQHVKDANEQAWRESGYDAEDAKPYMTKLAPYDGNTVQGEVVQSRYDVPPDRGPTDPPRYTPETDLGGP